MASSTDLIWLISAGGILAAAILAIIVWRDRDDNTF